MADSKVRTRVMMLHAGDLPRDADEALDILDLEVFDGSLPQHTMQQPADVILLRVAQPASRGEAEQALAGAHRVSLQSGTPFVVVADEELCSEEEARAAGARRYVPIAAIAELPSALRSLREELKSQDFRSPAALELLDEMGYAYFELDSRGCLIRSSLLAAEMLGYASREDAKGRRVHGIHFDDKESSREFTTRLLESGSARGEYLFRRLNREPFWVEILCRIVHDVRSRPAKFIGVCRDRTEIKAKDTYLAALWTMAMGCDRIDQVPPVACQALRNTCFARVAVFLVRDRENDALIVKHVGHDGSVTADLDGSHFLLGGSEPHQLTIEALNSHPLVARSGMLPREGEQYCLCPVGRAGEADAFVWLAGNSIPQECRRARGDLEEFLTAAAPIFGNILTLMKFRLHEAIQAASRRHETDGNRIDVFLRELLLALHQEMPFAAASIFHKDPFEPVLRLSATTGIRGNPPDKAVAYPFGHGLTGMVASEGKSRVMLSIPPSHTPSFPENIWEPSSAWAGIPIVGPGNETVGVLRVIDRLHPPAQTRSCFSCWDVELLKAAAQQAGMVLSLLGAEEQRAGLLDRVTHEIRAPANGIRANLDSLQRRLTTQDAAAFARSFRLKSADIELDAAVLLQLAQTLDGLFGPTQGETRPRQPERLRKILMTIIHQFKPELSRRGFDLSQVEVLLHTFPDLWIQRALLSQVFFNLLQNAIRYAIPDRPEEFRVEVGGSWSKQGGATIYFRDWGIGVLQNERERIFERGVRGRVAHQVAARGTGLGLSICRQIMQAHHGTIRVTRLSQPTELTLTFPSDLLELP